MKLLLVASNGGHLTQLIALRSWWEDHDRVWVTAEKPDAISLLEDERVVWSNHPTTRHVPNMVRNFRLAHRLISDYEPDVFGSAEAGAPAPRKLGKNPQLSAESFLDVDADVSDDLPPAPDPDLCGSQDSVCQRTDAGPYDAEAARKSSDG